MDVAVDHADSEYIYRTYRRAHAEIPPGLPDDWLRSPCADRFGTPFPKVGGEFLRSQFELSRGGGRRVAQDQEAGHARARGLGGGSRQVSSEGAAPLRAVSG